MEQEISFVREEINYLGINIERNPDSALYQHMSIALPQETVSDIEKINKNSRRNLAERQRDIEKILNRTKCLGYFFGSVPGMMYKNLYVEVCIGSLDFFIQDYQKKAKDLPWTVLPDLCCQLIDTVSWLHQRNIVFDGNLNPRSIYVKNSGTQQKVKLRVPDKLNPFNNTDLVYANSWSFTPCSADSLNAEEISLGKDISSIAILIYFIQSSGCHPFQIQPEFHNQYDKIQENIEILEWDTCDLLCDHEMVCFCEPKQKECKEKIPCIKYRSWVNKLAKDWVSNVLNELTGRNPSQDSHYTASSLCELNEHPFFWKPEKVLTFIERSSRHLNKGGDDCIKIKFGWSPDATKEDQEPSSPNNSLSTGNSTGKRIYEEVWLQENCITELRSKFENIVDFLHQIVTGNNQNMKIKQREDVENFYGLIRQIRNKSCHWKELDSELGKKVEEELENISFVAHEHMNVYPTKYVLFWMVHFPTLLLYTWNQLKDENLHIN